MFENFIYRGLSKSGHKNIYILDTHLKKCIYIFISFTHIYFYINFWIVTVGKCTGCVYKSILKIGLINHPMLHLLEHPVYWIHKCKLTQEKIVPHQTI